MKRLLFIAFTFFMAFSCKKEESVADFSYYQDHLTPGKVVFTDLSKNASSYDWNFGDGSASTEKNPQHVYSQNGTYKVALNVPGSTEVTKYVEVTTHPNTPPAATSGQCVFWTATSTYGQIIIRINGGNVGTITQYMTTGLAPNCGQTGFVTLEYPEGTYNFTAESTDGNWTWNGSFTIVNGECAKKQLS